MLETTIQPRLPYDLRLCAGGQSDATRGFRDGALTLAYEAGGAPAVARVQQRRDGSLAVWVDAEHEEPAHDALRWVLAADADHTPFLRRVASDPLLGRLSRVRRGYRPLRLATVAHALLRALAGQLIAAPEARRIENRLIRAVSPSLGVLRLPPTRAALGRLSAAEVCRSGLAPKRAAALVSVLRGFDLERLHGVPTAAAVRRVERERNLGPWSAGVISLYGLGRYEHGLVGDLGLVRLCSALAGRRVGVEETRALLEPYEEWAGLASTYLLAHPLSH